MFELFPTTTRKVRGMLLRWAVVLFAFIVLVYFVTSMPGKSYSGAFLPLTAEETLIRDNLKRHVVILSDSIGVRNVWAYDGLLRSERYIKTQLESGGSRVLEQRFVAESKDVANLEVILPGETAECIVVGAHYDSFGQSPAANDNGSGVAALIEILRILGPKHYKRTLRFVAFVNEEPPHFGTNRMGSLVYARSLKKEGTKVYEMYSLETIGCYFEEPGTQKYPFIFGLFYPDKANFISFVGNISSRALVRNSLRVFRESVQFPSQGTAAPGWIKGIGWSDHWSFWELGYKALMITDTAPYRYVHYHEISDTWDKIDFERMSRVVYGISKMIEVIANE